MKTMPILIIAAFATVAATTAFAQSFDPDFGTGNVRPVFHTEDSARHAAGARSGFDANAMAEPGMRIAKSDPNSPHATGGGSLGYNRHALVY